MTLHEILHTKILHVGELELMVYHLLALLALLIGTRITLVVLKRIIRRQIEKSSMDSGRALAFYQLGKYIVIIAALLYSLEIIGVHVTLLLAGSAALLVGLGFGIQQLFNDLVSGFVLLFEGTVSVGDIIEIDGLVGKITEINMRTSEVITREGIIIIVPNSKLVSDNVINWTHNRQLTRFMVTVGVAYGTDIELVEQIICEAARSHEKVASEPAPFARFVDFGESSLDMEVHFWSYGMWEVEHIKSDIRLSIYKAFAKQGVEIPFPQRDLHIKSNIDSKKQ